MVLPINEDDYSYRFYKTLNNDVKLKSNEYGEWDIVFDNTNNDWVNCTGFDSMANACIISIMTRYNELDLPPLKNNGKGLYEDFGCRVHELIKANKSKNILYRIELFITETLQNIRRVEKVNWVVVTDNPDKNKYNYRVDFSISCKRDEDIDIGDLDLSIIEDKFYI